jgi:hypothetical protein
VKKILMVLETNFSEDERVQKTCMSLSDLGFEIHIVFKTEASSQNFNYRNVIQYPFKFNSFLLKSFMQLV